MSVEEALVKYPTAKRNAVVNVTCGKEGKGMNYEIAMNLAMDARLYRWNDATVKAIKAVIG